MGLIVKDNGAGNFVLCPQGSHVAICIQIIDLGTNIFKTAWGPKTWRKVWITWELPEELVSNGESDEPKPMLISKEYTHSLAEKSTLRTHLQGWRGKAFTPDELDGFDLANLIGKSCMLGVVHETSKTSNKVYANINSIMKLPKNTQVPKQVNPSYLLSFDDEPYQTEIMMKLPDFLKQKIMGSIEWRERSQSHTELNYANVEMPDMEEDEIPF